MSTPKLTRRNALKALAGSAGLLLVSPGRRIADAAEEPLFQLREHFPSPVKIASVELLRRDQHDFVRVTSSDGATGTVLASERMAYLYPIFLQRVAPYFVGKDARDLEALVDGVYVHQSNNGGLIRTSRVARLAAGGTLDITPHAPQPGYHAVFMAHFASVTANLGRFQEYPAARFEQPSWYAPHPAIRNGVVQVPGGPGIGITIDEKFLDQAEIIRS